MPSPYVNKLAKETGKSVSEVEKLWDKAKEITSDTFGKKEDDFGSKEYSYTTGIVKNMLGVKEELLDPTKFQDSKLSAKQFIEEVMSSNQFDIGNVIPPKEVKEKPIDIEMKEPSLHGQLNPDNPTEELENEDDSKEESYEIPAGSLLDKMMQEASNPPQ